MAVIDVGLTRRELQILAEVEGGATNRMVAEKLKLSEKTVKHYMGTIMQKCGALNRVSAVMVYQKMRLAVIPLNSAEFARRFLRW